MGHDDAESDQLTTALLLAAGSGCRLRPLTDDQPKCLTEINGIPILERLVDSLCQQGFERLVVVVGYLQHAIRDFLERWNADLSIEFVVNPRYSTTNNIYSLWLARNVIHEPFVLIESDLIFQPELLGDLLPPDKMAVSSLQPWMNGSTVTVDQFQRVRELRLGGANATGGRRYKTVNTCSLSRRSWRQVIARLGRYIEEGRVNEFYERVFAEMIADGVLCFQAVFLDPKLWYEIDTLHDLHEAETLFAANSRDQPTAS